MELFLFGLFVGIAIGMWGAILLYRLSGKAEPGWPFRRNKDGKTSSSKAMYTGGPADDFTDEYYAQQESHAGQSYTRQSAEKSSSQRNAGAVPVPAEGPAASQGDVTSSDAGSTITYTDAGYDANKYTSAKAGVSSATVQPNAELAEAAEAGAQTAAYTILLASMNGDVQATEALIEAERQRTPAVPRPRLIENALLRWQYGQE
jgi:hypothetical protein